MRSVNTVNLVLSVLVITRGGFEVGAACSQRAGFTTLYHEAIQNKALFNHVFKSLTNTIDRVECFQACVGDCRCMSYNFQENPSVDGTRHCELNSADYKSDTFALMIRAGFAYYDIRPIFNSAQVKRNVFFYPFSKLLGNGHCLCHRLTPTRKELNKILIFSFIQP